MTSSDGKKDKGPAEARETREQRRAAALRANLQRRKAQMRARQAPEPATPTSGGKGNESGGGSGGGA